MARTDPELIEVFDNFAFDEVLTSSTLDTRVRLMVQLAALIACNAVREYLAKLLGATVIGAASTAARREAALASGADHVVDYTQPGWDDAVRELTGGQGADLVLQMGGDETIRQALGALAPFGRVVVLGVPGRRPLTLDPATSESFFHVQMLNQSLHSFGVGFFFGLRPEAVVRALTTLVGYVATGRVKVPITVLPRERAADAHRQLENREATGIEAAWPARGDCADAAFDLVADGWFQPCMAHDRPGGPQSQRSNRVW